MPSNCRATSRFASLPLVAAALLLGACGAFGPLAPVEEDLPGPVAEAEPPPQPDPEPIPVRPPAPVPVVPETPALPPVAIVITSSLPAYTDVARELAARLDRYEVYDLGDRREPPVTVLRRVNDSESKFVVAIGLKAAESSVSMARSPVVFSQVFNHQDHDLLKSNSRGVAALPPLAAQIMAWKEIKPDLMRLGMILGSGHEDLVAEAEAAARQVGIELTVRESKSDQETLYLFRRMVRDIDGFWLLPDNRVLSPRVLQQMIAEANRVQVPVSVPNDSMLEMGASVSFSTLASDIAARILDLLHDMQRGRLASIPPITPLSEIRVTVSEGPQVAER